MAASSRRQVRANLWHRGPIVSRQHLHAAELPPASLHTRLAEISSFVSSQQAIILCGSQKINNHGLGGIKRESQQQQT